MLSKINLEVKDINKTRIIKLEGKMLLGYAANDFHEAILKAIEEKSVNIMVDLSELNGITCWGIGMLIYGYTCAKMADINFYLIGVPNKISNELVRLHIDTLIKQFDSVEDALEERYNLST